MYRYTSSFVCESSSQFDSPLPSPNQPLLSPQLLALSTRGYVNLKQSSTFGDIAISKRSKFDQLEL